MVLVCLTYAPVFADDAPLDEIVVSATRMESTIRDVTRALSVVNKERIQAATQQLALDEALAGVPGLYMQNRYNFAQDLRVSLRGFGARSSFGIRGIRIFVDDIPESLPDGQAQVDSIDIGSAERIEILRGPSSSLYGNASGGVISVQSELGNSSPYAEVRVAAGDYGFRKLQLKSAGAMNSVAYLFNASRQEIDGYRDHSLAEGSMVNAKVAYDLTKIDRLVISLNHTDQPTADDPGGISAEQAAADPRSARDLNVSFNAGESLNQQRVGLVYRHDGETNDLMLRSYFVWREFGNVLPFTAGGMVDLDRFFYGGGAQYSVGLLADKALSLTTGFDVDLQDDDRKRFDNNAGSRGVLVFDQNEFVTAAGAYANVRYAISDALNVDAGLRLDNIDFDVTDNYLVDGDDSGVLDFQETSASVGINLSLGPGALFASYSDSFETPTTTELANPDGSGGFNPSLKAQTAVNYEIGFRGDSADVFYEVVIFHIDLEDELIPYELPAFPGRTFFQNAGKSSRQGIETALSWRSESGLGVDVSYTYSDFTYDEFMDDSGNDFAGKQLPGLPRHFGYLGLSYQSEKGLYGTVEASYSGSLYANNANDVSVDSYVVSNIRTGYRMHTGRWLFEPYVGINNLFDTTYNSNIRVNAFGGRYYEPAPERNIYVGFVTRFE